MPSTQLFVQSGGIGLLASDVYSGSPQLVGGVQLVLESTAPGIVYVGLPNLSGTVNTITSGGSLTAGGMADALPMSPGQDYFIPKTRLTSGIASVRLLGAAASSGARVFWEVFGIAVAIGSFFLAGLGAYLA